MTGQAMNTMNFIFHYAPTVNFTYSLTWLQATKSMPLNVYAYGLKENLMKQSSALITAHFQKV